MPKPKSPSVRDAIGNGMKSNLGRARKINQIADDWLLVYPNTHKAQLLGALGAFTDGHLDEVYSFHERIVDFPADQKRKVLADLPKDAAIYQ